MPHEDRSASAAGRPARKAPDKSGTGGGSNPAPDMDRKMLRRDCIKDGGEVYGENYMLSDSEVLDFSEGADSD